MYPYVQSTSSVAVNDPFRVRSLGNMRHFSGIEGVPCEVVPLVNKNGMTSLVNIQLLEQADSSRILVLTYNDNLYYKETAEKILSLFCKHLMRIIQNGDGK